MSSFFSAKPKTKKKGCNNFPSEPTDYQSMHHGIKLDEIRYHRSDVDKESYSDDPNKFQGNFINKQINYDLKTDLTVYCCNASIKGGSSNKIGKVSGFCQKFTQIVLVVVASPMLKIKLLEC